MLLHPEPLRDRSGEMVGAVNLLVDITGRKQTEDRLRESEARFRAMVEATPECVKVISCDGTVLEMNPVGLDMVEAERAEEVIGRSIYDLIAPEDQAAFHEFNESVCHGESGRLEFDIIGLRGTRRRMEGHSVPLPDAKGELTQLAVLRDVTDERRAAELRKAMPPSSSRPTTSSSRRPRRRHHELEQGGRADPRLHRRGGHRQARLDAHARPSGVEDTAKILGRIRRGEKVDHYQTRRRRKDGTLIDVSLTVSPIRDADGPHRRGLEGRPGHHRPEAGPGAAPPRVRSGSPRTSPA